MLCDVPKQQSITTMNPDVSNKYLELSKDSGYYEVTKSYKRKHPYDWIPLLKSEEANEEKQKRGPRMIHKLI